MPLVVFNLLSWERSDVAEAEIGFGEPNVKSFALLDALGKPVPYQISHSEQSDDGDIHFAKIVFVARDVPSMGHAVYHAVPNSQASAGGVPSATRASARNTWRCT